MSHTQLSTSLSKAGGSNSIYIKQEKTYMTPKEVTDAAELEVRRYFDHFLETVHPKLMSEHFNSCKHGTTLNKFKWIFVGMAVAIAILAPAVGAEILSLLKKITIG